ncbi:MAG: FG-GAP-like repeat-containing protein [Phycisphaerales bacterium JB064]
MAEIGDVDGDGVNDLALGAPRAVAGTIPGGSVWIVFMAADGRTKSTTRIGPEGVGGLSTRLSSDAFLGNGVDGLGDLDGDGIPEIIVGASGDDEAGRDRGAVFVLFLNRDGTVREEVKFGMGMGGFDRNVSEDSRFGTSVATLGDIDGDGTLEVAVGHPFEDVAPGQLDDGAAWIVSLNQAGMVEREMLVGAGQGGFTGAVLAGDNFGNSVGGGEDIDGDGVPDLVVGASRDDAGGIDAGAAYVVFLNRGGTVKGETKITSGFGGLPPGLLDPREEFGSGVDFLPDINGDGVPDLAAGVWLDTDGRGITGTTWIFFLGRDGRVMDRQKIDENFLPGLLGPNGRFGWGVSAASRDDEGNVRLLVGASTDSTHGLDEAGTSWMLSLKSCSRCLADVDGDGELTLFDYLAFQILFDLGSPLVDFDGDGVLTLFDFLAFQNAFDAGCA